MWGRYSLTRYMDYKFHCNKNSGKFGPNLGRPTNQERTHPPRNMIFEAISSLCEKQDIDVYSQNWVKWGEMKVTTTSLWFWICSLDWAFWILALESKFGHSATKEGYRCCWVLSIFLMFAWIVGSWQRTQNQTKCHTYTHAQTSWQVALKAQQVEKFLRPNSWV